MSNVIRTKRIAKWFAGAISLVMIILIPLFFVALESKYIKGNLDSEALINSRIISRLINANPEMWKFEIMRFEEILSHRPTNGEKEIRRILDNNNKLIAESADEISPPFIKISHDLKESGVTVGKIEIYRSWSSVLWNTLYVSIFGMLLAAMTFVAIRVLPFRALIRAEGELKESEEKFRALFEQASIGVAEVDTKTERFIRVNQKYCDIFGYSIEEMMAMTHLQITHPDDLPLDLDKLQEIEKGEIRDYSREKRHIRKDGSIVWVNLTISSIFEKGVRSDRRIAVIKDITERKHVEEERNQLIVKLQQALDEVRTLSGLLPICSYCKNVRDDQGYWNEIEAYIYKHSGAEFTHGICPECVKKHFPMVDLDCDKKTRG